MFRVALRLPQLLKSGIDSNRPTLVPKSHAGGSITLSVLSEG